MASWDAVSFLRGVFPTILFVPLPDSSDLAYPIWKVWENLGKPMRRKSILPLVSQQSQNCAASARWKSANANHRPHTHLIISTKHVKQFSISIQARCLHRKKTRKAVQEKRVRNENVLASGRSSWVQPSNQTKPNQTKPQHTTVHQTKPHRFWWKRVPVCGAAFLSLSAAAVVVLAMAKSTAALVDAACSWLAVIWASACGKEAWTWSWNPRCRWLMDSVRWPTFDSDVISRSRFYRCPIIDLVNCCST